VAEAHPEVDQGVHRGEVAAAEEASATAVDVVGLHPGAVVEGLVTEADFEEVVEVDLEIAEDEVDLHLVVVEVLVDEAVSTAEATEVDHLINGLKLIKFIPLIDAFRCWNFLGFMCLTCVYSMPELVGHLRVTGKLVTLLVLSVDPWGRRFLVSSCSLQVQFFNGNSLSEAWLITNLARFHPVNHWDWSTTFFRSKAP
jgi:hypothetical protein